MDFKKALIFAFVCGFFGRQGNADAVTASVSSDSQTHLVDRANSLEYFFDRLSRARRPNDGPVRITFFSTSSNGYDRVSSQMRRKMQAQFGDGGKGFITASRSWKHLRQQDIEWAYSGFKTFRVTTHNAKDGLYGLGGIRSYNPEGQKATVTYATVEDKKSSFVPGTKFSKATILFRVFPGGGTMRVAIDGKWMAPINTDRRKAADQKVTYDVPDGPHQLMIETDERSVQIYGVIFERNAGVVVDAIPLIGAKVRHLLNYDPLQIRQHIRMRDPDLLIFQFGENDAVKNPDPKELKAIQTAYVEGIKTFRSGKPKASCLIVSVKDIAHRKTKKTLPGIPRVVDLSRNVAEEAGCAFFDLFQALGGEGTMRRWREHNPPLVSKDYGHLLNPGARKVGDVISGALMEQYAEFRARRREQRRNLQ